MWFYKIVCGADYKVWTYHYDSAITTAIGVANQKKQPAKVYYCEWLSGWRLLGGGTFYPD